MLSFLDPFRRQIHTLPLVRNPIRRHGLLAFWLLGFGVPGELATQSIEKLERPPACSSCEILLQRETVIRDSPEAPLGQNIAVVAHDSRGRYYVPSRISPGEIFVFDGIGRQIDAFGRRGGGPGEYYVVNEIRARPGDSLVLYDNVNRRETVLSPDFEVVRSRRIQAVIRGNELTVLPEGMLAFAGPVSTPERVALPLHVIGPQGAVVRSFGASDTVAYVASPYAMNRALSPAGEKGFWSAHRTGYLLEEWDTEGNRIRAIDGNAPWFRPWSQDEPISPDSPPRPWIQSIRVDAAGYLWVLCRVTSPEFELGLGVENTERGDFYSLEDWDQVFDTVIEVIDPARGTLMVSERVDSYLTRFLADDLIVGFAQDSAGVPRLDIWRVSYLRNDKE